MKKLSNDFIEHVMNFYKSIDCKYFVIKIEDLLESMNELDYFDLTKILKQYNQYRKEQEKKENSYFVLNREEYNKFKNADEFIEFMENIQSTNTTDIMDNVMKYCNITIDSLQEYLNKIMIEHEETRT